jgi:hypothetical protein
MRLLEFFCLLESACPGCGKEADYVGLNSVECSTKGCRNFKPKPEPVHNSRFVEADWPIFHSILYKTIKDWGWTSSGYELSAERLEALFVGPLMSKKDFVNEKFWIRVLPDDVTVFVDSYPEYVYRAFKLEPYNWKSIEL